MLILAVDSSGSRESVALVRDERLLGEVHLEFGELPSRRILPAVAFLLDTAGLRADQVDAFAVALGPGSFTGLRVGIATVQGLALGRGRPCVGVSTLDALAELGRGAELPVLALLAAQRGEVYAALYDAAGRSSGPARRATLDAVLAELPDELSCVGEGVQAHTRALLAARPRARLCRGPFFLAWPVARLALRRLREPGEHRPEDLRPLYLGDAHVTLRRAGPAGAAGS